MYSDADLCVDARGSEFVFQSAASARADKSAFRLSSIFGATSFEPATTAPQCVGQLVTSGITGGSVTAGSFKLWLFNFLNANVFPAAVEVSGVEDGRRQDSMSSLLTWISSFLFSDRAAADATPAPSLDALPECAVSDDLIDTEDDSKTASDCEAKTTLLEAATVKTTTAAAAAATSLPRSSLPAARQSPDYALHFKQFFFGLNYGVVLLPTSVGFVFNSTLFAPLRMERGSLLHPEAPSPAWQRPEPAPAHAASAAEVGTRPYAPVLSTVRSPIRRHGNVAWYSECGIPLPFSWLVLQLAFGNFAQLVGATAVAVACICLLYSQRNKE